MTKNVAETTSYVPPEYPDRLQEPDDKCGAPEGSLAYLAGEVGRAFTELMEKRANRRAQGDAVGMYSGN